MHALNEDWKRRARQMKIEMREKTEERERGRDSSEACGGRVGVFLCREPNYIFDFVKVRSYTVESMENSERHHVAVASVGLRL